MDSNGLEFKSGNTTLVNQEVTVQNKVTFTGNGGAMVKLEGVSSVSRSRTAVTSASYTILATDTLVGVNYAGDVTLTLPEIGGAEDPGEGNLLIIKDESGEAGNNNITVNCSGSDTMDGTVFTSATLDTDGQAIKIYHDGTSVWHFENN